VAETDVVYIELPRKAVPGGGAGETKGLARLAGTFSEAGKSGKDVTYCGGTLK
jgi:hypothetical protein